MCSSDFFSSRQCHTSLSVRIQRDRQRKLNKYLCVQEGEKERGSMCHLLSHFIVEAGAVAAAAPP